MKKHNLKKQFTWLKEEAKMTIKEAIDEFKNNKNVAKDILCFVLNKDKQYLLINMDEKILKDDYNKFIKLMNEVLNGKPLQYITNVQSFMGFDFYVDENVLIPQPDTEVIVEQVINIFEKVYAKKPNVKILDLCTGSGAIAISLDKILNKYDNIKVYASDISASAINVAKKNSTRLNTNVEFIESNMFYSINNKFDIIVSNPPYIETNIIDTLASDVQAEPHLALDGGKDGLNFYRNIADNAYNYLTKSGYICLEIGYNQGETVKEILDKTKKYKNIEVIKDYSGNYRCVMAMGV